MIKLLTFTLTIISAVCAIISYICGFIAPTHHYIFGIIALSAPIWLTINLLSLPYLLIKNWKNLFFPILSLLVCFPLLQRSYQFSKEKDLTKTNPISVLNYNTCVFGVYDEMVNKEIHNVKSMTDYLLDSDADVLCLNEFYNDHRNDKDYNTTEILHKIYPYSYIKISYTNHLKHEFGQAIFSKYPIVNKQTLEQAKGGNFTIFTDIKAPKGTFRVYCTHLASMSLPQNINKALQKDEKTRDIILNKFERGFKARTEQVRGINTSIIECSIPVILAGDFNDTPYSYAYNKLSTHLTNSFEMKGSGFGFTYNSEKQNPWLFPLRIDNQFYSDETLSCLDFNTDRTLKHSDHFPSIGIYTFKQ